MLYTNCNILSMSRNDFENGFILTENGMIKAVGDMRQLPGYDRGVNLRGRTVIPAFVDAHCHLGMWEDGLGFEGDDGNEATDPVTSKGRTATRRWIPSRRTCAVSTRLIPWTAVLRRRCAPAC